MNAIENIHGVHFAASCHGNLKHQYYHMLAHYGIMVFIGMNPLLTLFDIMII